MLLYGIWQMVPSKYSVESKPPTVPKTMSIQGWQLFEDSRVRFQRPKGWETYYYTSSVPAERRIWFAKPVGATGEIGEISLTEQLDGREKRPLDRIIADSVSGTVKVISPPKPVDIKGAKCVSYIVEGPSANPFCGDIIVPGKRAICITATAHADCYRDNGNYISVSSFLSAYSESGKSDNWYYRNVQVFDHFLQSLDFER